MIAAISYNVCLNRNGYVNRHEERQVVVELYQQGRRRTVNTHIHVPPRCFARGRIQACHPDHDLLNRRIRRIVRQLMELEDEMVEAGQEPTPDLVADGYSQHLTRSATITEWVESVISPSKRRTVTKSSYRTLMNSIEAFRPGLRIGEVTYDFVERWQNWMRNERRLSENTIAVRLKGLRCLVSEAVKRGVVRADDDPFRRIRIPEIQARHEHLSEQELRAIEEVDLGDDRRLSHVRDAFLFCCYTGLRWGDFSRLTAANLSGHTLTVRQHKTGQELKLPLDAIWYGKAGRLVDGYGSIERLADVGANRDCNRDIREVGRRAGVGQRLHWHLARHTCGTLLNQHGLHMHEIQYVLGHRKLSTTERHYAETLYQQVERSLVRAFGQVADGAAMGVGRPATSEADSGRLEA